MNVDVVERDPFHLDVIQASVGPYAPVALEVTILHLIVSASLSRLSFVFHPWSGFVSTVVSLFNYGLPLPDRLLDQGLVIYRYN